MTIYEQLRKHLTDETKPSDELRAQALATAEQSERGGNNNYSRLVRALLEELGKLKEPTQVAANLPKPPEDILKNFPVEQFAKIPDARPKILKPVGPFIVEDPETH